MVFWKNTAFKVRRFLLLSFYFVQILAPKVKNSFDLFPIRIPETSLICFSLQFKRMLTEKWINWTLGSQKKKKFTEGEEYFSINGHYDFYIKAWTLWGLLESHLRIGLTRNILEIWEFFLDSSLSNKLLQ